MQYLLSRVLSVCFALGLLVVGHSLYGQSGPMRSQSASEIKLSLKKLGVVGSVMYVAAHPDDENTRMITYLANDLGLNTAYLSLTRGDGGQNLIGKEVTEQLGLIRTQELLEARKIDGGVQYFSRAFDFGFSKNSVETFSIWEREKVLEDVVWAIRLFKPDVIITRFSPTSDGETHGHHTASAKLIMEAFHAAADPTKFPSQLQHVAPWQAKRALWNTSSWFYRTRKDMDFSKMLKVDVGTYNPFLGKSHGEIAAESRSMHKSQGFGSAMQRGREIEYLVHLIGDSATTTLFERVDITWGRIPGSDKIAEWVEKAYKGFDMENPQASLPTLFEVHKALIHLQNSADPTVKYYIQLKKEALEELVFQCAGLWMEAVSQDYIAAPGDSLFVRTKVVGRNPSGAILKEIVLPHQELFIDSTLATNVMAEWKDSLALPLNMPYSQPYWLGKPVKEGLFEVEKQTLIGKPENDSPLQAGFTFAFAAYPGVTFTRLVPLMYQWVDPVDGERYRPVAIAPPVTVNITDPAYIYADEEGKPVVLTLKNFTHGTKGKLSLSLPKGWKTEPAIIDFEFKEKYEEKTLTFHVIPPSGASSGHMKAVVEVNGLKLSHGLVTINYPHIAIQVLFPTAEASISKLDIRKAGERIGYISGAGDVLPEALRQIGYTVDLLKEEDIQENNLKKYDAIITGVRAYNTNERLRFHQPVLLSYVQQGGTLLVQYNTNARLVTQGVGPYPLTISRDRVTDENAEVTFLNPMHEALNFPNKITRADFDGWVQERGLYFPNKWDERFEPLLRMNDPGEDPTDGSVLVTTYGEGKFVYTGLSFFRQLPAGVPGAYRLLVNLLSYGKKDMLTREKQ